MPRLRGGVERIELLVCYFYYFDKPFYHVLTVYNVWSDATGCLGELQQPSSAQQCFQARQKEDTYGLGHWLVLVSSDICDHANAITI